jgi:hypothetical protein
MDYVTFRNKVYKVKKGALSLKNKGVDDIAEIVGLQDLIGLKQLDLSYNNISEIKNLETSKDLFSLDLSNNKLTQIKGLETLQNLRFLKLSNNYIREIVGLSTLTNLMTLYLDKNSIFEIKGLDNLKRLNALYLAGNRITVVTGIERLPNLKRFDLGTKPLVPEEQIKKVKASGVHVKDQNYFGKRFLKRLMWYCIGIAIVDLIITASLGVIFQNPPIINIFIFLGIFGLLFIFSPLLYVLGRAYAGV